MSDFEVKLTKVIPASAETVFEAWLDPEALAKFMTPAEGVTVPKAESDAREGGEFLVVMQAGEKEMPHSGIYKTIDKYQKLVFTWNSPFASDASLVTLDFREVEGATELTLHHTGLPSEESRNNHNGGWTRIVDVLGKLVS